MSGEDWIYTWYATPTHHTLTGLWSSGCQLHDNCCRSLTDVGCVTLCNYLVPPTVVAIGVDGEYRVWAYDDYSWRVDTQYLGYSGCTCPGVPPYSEDYECVK